jgi:hypothetical protein
VLASCQRSRFQKQPSLFSQQGFGGPLPGLGLGGLVGGLELVEELEGETGLGFGFGVLLGFEQQGGEA